MREPDGPPGWPLVGNFYQIYPDHLGNHYRLFLTYGSVIKTVCMGATVYLTWDPEVAAHAFSESAYFTKKIVANHPLAGIKDNTAIFLGDTETETWSLAHKFVPPAMSPKAVRRYTPMMQASCESSFPVFDELDRRGEAWNAYQYMLKLASQTVARFTLGLDLHHFDSPEAPIHEMVQLIAETLALNKKISNRGDWYRNLPFGDPKRLRELKQRLARMLEEATDRAMQPGASDLPLNEAALEATCVVDYLMRAVDGNGEKLPRDLVYSNTVVVTGAGFTTTSTLLAWCLYALTTYEGCQERLLQELVDHGITEETQWTPDLVHSLPFLDKFVKEVQRMHNPSFQPGRTTKTDVILPGGYHLPANSVLIPALYAIHMNPHVWDNPMRFDPDRWDTEAVKKRHRCAYIPFATGPRGCIGFNFALQETKLFIAMLVNRYEFWREGTGSIQYDGDFQLVRPLNLYVRARRRTAWPAPSASP